jgi:hypothetical protein
MPIDSRAGVPATVRLKRVIYPHREVILSALVEMRSQIVGKSDESIRPYAERGSVDPDLASLIHSVELKDDSFPRCFGRKSELLSVPANPCGQIGPCSARRSVFSERTLDAPVMWQVKDSPPVISKVR